MKKSEKLAINVLLENGYVILKRGDFNKWLEDSANMKRCLISKINSFDDLEIRNRTMDDIRKLHAIDKDLWLKRL